MIYTKVIICLLGLIMLTSCKDKVQEKPELVVEFKGLQVTGTSVSESGRIFANFPRWRPSIPFSVVEVSAKDGSYKSFPDQNTNSWREGKEVSDSLFVAVQSVVCHNDKLYVLDTRNPFFAGVVDQPRIFVFDLSSNKLSTIYYIPEPAFKKSSYVNDLRVDDKNGKIYLTDSGEAGIIIIDTKDKSVRRVLDNHYSTMAETDHLTINKKRWDGKVNSDGIALDAKNDKLFYHALTGYTMYAIESSTLGKDDKAIEKGVTKVDKTAAPDGNLYFADLENNSICYITPKGKQKILYQGEEVKWADSFSYHDDYLYYTNSRINEAGLDVSAMNFNIYKVKI